MSVHEVIKKIRFTIRNNTGELSLFNLRLNEKELEHIIPYLFKIQNLNYLFLKNSNIANYNFIKGLNSLTVLDLSHNNLTDSIFSKELKEIISAELENLVTLDLSGNSLTNIELPYLPNLKSLNLRSNNLSKIKFPELDQLRKLDLRDNKLTKIDFLKEFKELTSLYLHDNELDLPDYLLKMIRDQEGYNSPLGKTQIDQIVNYYKQLEEQGTACIYEARVLIVGEPGAGKTTLFRKLRNNGYLPLELTDEEKQSTVGVEIDKEWKFPFIKDKSKEFIAHLWDFGGQKIQYSLHQYFLTEKSLYILLADDRKQLNNFHYWFEIIATLGVGCPVLVILNEINHESITNFSLKEYRDQFENKIKTIDKLDVDFSREDGRFQVLQNDIQTKLSNLEHIGKALPAQWKVIRNKLELLSSDNAYISIDEYHSVCKENRISEREDARNLLDYLHYLGIALNYKGDENLEDIVILSPNWIIDALYAVLKNKEIKDNFGKFDKEHVFELWKNDGYENSKDYKLLLSLMLKGKFEIAYKLKKVNEYIVPLLLPEIEPEYNFNNINIIQIYLKYKFMPAGILSRLIVRLNENIVEQNNKQIVWEKGVLLRHKTSVAQVTENQYQRQIIIKVSGTNFIYNREAVTIIRNELERIHIDWFDNRLEVEEFVPCICDICKFRDDKQFYSLQELEDYLSSEDFEIKCAKSRSERKPKSIIVRKLLEGVYIEDKAKGHKKTPNVFNISNLGQLVNQSQESVIQNNYLNDYESYNRKLDEMFAKVSEIQSLEIKDLTDELINAINEKLVKIDRLNEEEMKAFEEMKLSNDWKARLKIGLPFKWFTEQLTGVSFELEKELKLSQEISPDRIISVLRKITPANELQKTGFNEIEIIKNKPKILKS